MSTQIKPRPAVFCQHPGPYWTNSVSNPLWYFASFNAYITLVRPPKDQLITDRKEKCIASSVLPVCHFSMPVTADSHKHAGPVWSRRPNPASERGNNFAFDYKADMFVESHLSVGSEFSQLGRWTCWMEQSDKYRVSGTGDRWAGDQH